MPKYEIIRATLYNQIDYINKANRLLFYSPALKCINAYQPFIRPPCSESVQNLSQTQRERLAYIEFRLLFLGEVGRQDLIQRFCAAPAVATRDFAQYREAFPNNISFNGKTKSYVLGNEFSPASKHFPDQVLTVLAHGFGDGGIYTGSSLLPCELPLVLSRPTIDILAPISRAIHQQKIVSLDYRSHTSRLTKGEIAPFALVNDGLRWRVRSYDRKSNEFRDFVLTRMEDVSVIHESTLQKHELPSADIQWNRIVELDLVPHPNQEHAEIIEGDYGMIAGVLHIKLRASIAGYALRQLIVDCSPSHSLKGKEYRLWLKNHLAFYGVSSAILAPGYKV
ncbi:MAG: WYL domain-containing protein [Methylobacter sp.]|nr:WYL domain-containing protein [Methylobacter sp.]